MNRCCEKLFRALLACVSALVLLLAPAARADEAAEQKVKAAFIPHLVSFVTWPDSSFTSTNAPMRVGILGDFPLGEGFDAALAKQSTQGHAFVITHYRKIEDALAAHVLLVGASEKENLPAILAATAGHSILTIGDTAGFAAHGGVINFIREDGKVRFEINPAVAAQGNLKISARLLQVARLVQP
jgi:hypothetical protein